MIKEVSKQQAVSEMLREIKEDESQYLNNVARELTYYLNKAQAITKDYQYTRILGIDPSVIINMDNEELKRIAAMIYICYENIGRASHRISYGGDGFEVKIIQYEAPF